jgi:hypothetical protein
MASINGTYKCGHAGNVYRPGGGKETTRKLQWILENCDCPECERKAREEEQNKKNAEAKFETEKMDLPQLTGTEKQIAWANTIRLKKLQEFDELFNTVSGFEKPKRTPLWQYNKYYFPDNDPLDVVLTMKDLISQSKTQATFWINNRQFQVHDLMIDNNDLVNEVKIERK